MYFILYDQKGKNLLFWKKKKFYRLLDMSVFPTENIELSYSLWGSTHMLLFHNKYVE